MFDLHAVCPHCDETFKLNGIGLEAKEFMRCPHCRAVIKLDAADPVTRGLRTTQDAAG